MTARILAPIVLALLIASAQAKSSASGEHRSTIVQHPLTVETTCEIKYLAHGCV